jgi:hypothetical protein
MTAQPFFGGTAKCSRPPRSAREIDWNERLVKLDVDRQKIKDSPPYDPSTTVDRA